MKWIVLAGHRLGQGLGQNMAGNVVLIVLVG